MCRLGITDSDTRPTSIARGFLFLTISLATFLSASAIDCYKCTSIDGDNIACEDEFKRDLSTIHFIVRNCTYSFFDGTHCVKLKGIRPDGARILVRSCIDQDWKNSCGNIKYEDVTNEPMTGCLSSCARHGCNSAPRLLPGLHAVWGPTVAVLFVMLNNG